MNAHDRPVALEPLDPVARSDKRPFGADRSYINSEGHFHDSLTPFGSTQYFESLSAAGTRPLMRDAGPGGGAEMKVFHEILAGYA
jgi:hypothetical protein